MEVFLIPHPNILAKPGDFIGRKAHIEAFRSILQQGLATGTTSSVAMLGDWGIGKSSLLLKFTATCSAFGYRMLPVFLSVSKDPGDYLRLAESLLDKLAEALATSSSLAARLRSEVQNWKLERVRLAGFQLDREASPFFLSSGSALLRRTLAEAWERFLRTAHIHSAIFFLDDLHNFAGPSPETIVWLLRERFQSLAIEGGNYSLGFSARPDYFSTVRDLPEPAVRFFDKAYLAPFTRAETTAYTGSVFGPASTTSHHLFRGWHEKALGHAYFPAFVCLQLLAIAQGSPPANPALLWLETFGRLEQEKFRTELAQLSEKEVDLLHAIASAPREQITPAQMGHSFDRVRFSRLTEKGLLLPTERGRYKLYHPLFKLFLQRLKPRAAKRTNAQWKQRLCTGSWRPEATTDLPRPPFNPFAVAQGGHHSVFPSPLAVSISPFHYHSHPHSLPRPER